MPLILGAQSAPVIAQDTSCRFNGADGAFMTKAQGTPTSRRTYTMSVWFKLSLGAPTTALDYSDRTLFSAGSSGGNIHEVFIANNSSAGNNWSIRFTLNNAADYTMATSRMFRDVGAWYHMVAAVDTTQVTEADRVKLYINGVQETSFSYGPNYPTQDYDVPSIVSGQNIGMGARMLDDTRFMDGYMAEAVFIDGLALAPTSFGEFDSDSPTIWKPIDVSGLTFGTNGFYLDFKDSANLGNDANGGTDLTETNLVPADQSQDTPGNNFATWNSLWVPAGTLPTFYQGSTVVFTQDGSGKYFGAASTLGMTAGKWYAEIQPFATGATTPLVGIGGDISENVVSTDNFLGSEPYNYAYMYDGTKVNNSTYTAYGDTYTVGDIMGVAVDLDNLKIYFAKNGVWQDSGDPTSGATGTGAAFTITAAASMTFPQDGAYFFACSDISTGSVKIAANFGNGCFNNTVVTSSAADGNGYGLFEYAPPSGYLALCTKNLGSDGG